MYYNIKIKSNGSEFSLESNNKEVTQREMDMYFAHIFDVSQEFKSQIKKIEIKNANVKSIEEIENYAKSLASKQPTIEIKPVEIKQKTQIEPPSSPTIAPTKAPIQAPYEQTKQILPEIKITSTPIQPQIERIVVEQPNLAQNTQTLSQVSLQNSAQPIIQNIPPSPSIQTQQEQIFVQQNQNINLERLNQYNHQPTQAEIEGLLNKYIESSIEPAALNSNNPLQETPTLQNYFDSVTMPSEEIKENYEHQKEILEIKFDNIPSFNKQEGGYGYGEISTKNIEIELQEIDELDSIQPMSYKDFTQEHALASQPSENTIEQITPQYSNSEPSIEQTLSQFDYNKIATQQTLPQYSYNEVQVEQTIPQPIYTEPKILIKSDLNFDLENQQAPVAQNDIDELISLAQNKLDSFDINQETPKPQITIKQQEVDQSYETIDFDLSNSKFANNVSYKNTLAEEKEKYNKNSQEKINQIFSKEQPETSQEQTLQEYYLQQENANKQQLQEIFQEEYEQDITPAEIDIKNESSINLGNIELDFEPTIQGISQTQLAKSEYREYSQEERQQILSTPELTSPTTDMPTMQIPVAGETTQIQPQPTQIAQIAYENPTQIAQQNIQATQETPAQVTTQAQSAQQLSQGSYTQDFKLYLNEFNCETQSDHFLICAFYIKNILKQESFTMKSINSKLFQATGAIADLGILDDLVSKAYIRVINTPDSTKYCITPDGEGYFVSRFQG